MPATTLDDLLALLPDNDTGAIDAADLRTAVTALWYKSAIGGQVTSDGTLAYGPPGWTASRSGAGIYTVTHNLGTLDYAVNITPLTKTPDQGLSASIVATAVGMFTFQVFNSSTQSLHDVWTTFVVAVN
jgi:hypothetical protein